MADEKARKPIYKRWWFWVVIIIIIGAIGSSGEDKSNSNGQVSSSMPTQQSEQTQQPSEQSKPQLSKEGLASNVKFVVLKSSTSQTVGKNQFAKATASGIFKVIEVSVTNNQNDAITMDSNLFKLIDDKAREFTASSDGQMAVQVDEKEGLFLKQINPGLTVKGSIVFDVPPDAKGFKLQARGGMTGDEIELKVD